MSHSASVSELVAPFDQNDAGFFLKDRKAGEVLEIRTAKGYTYFMFIGDPANGDVALSSPDRPELEGHSVWFSLQGSTAGGSAVKIGWIGVGLCLRLNSLTGPGLAVLSPTESIRWIDGEQAEIIRVEAETTRPRDPTPEEIEARETEIRTWLTNHSWGEHEKTVKRLLAQFSFPNGQVHIATILEEAQKVGKLDQGLMLINSQLQDHWGFRPPHMRGEIITEKDVYYLELAYSTLGITPPNKKEK